jgi:hypothetical protein
MDRAHRAWTAAFRSDSSVCANRDQGRKVNVEFQSTICALRAELNKPDTQVFGNDRILWLMLLDDAQTLDRYVIAKSIEIQRGYAIGMSRIYPDWNERLDMAVNMVQFLEWALKQAYRAERLDAMLDDRC